MSEKVIYVVMKGLWMKGKMISVLERAMDKLDKGMIIAAVICYYAVNEQTVSFIEKCEDYVRGSFKASHASVANICCVSRRGPLSREDG